MSFFYLKLSLCTNETSLQYTILRLRFLCVIYVTTFRTCDTLTLLETYTFLAKHEVITHNRDTVWTFDVNFIALMEF